MKNTTPSIELAAGTFRVYCPEGSPVTPAALLVRMERFSQTPSDIPWLSVVESLTTDLAVELGAITLTLSAHDRYLVDGLGWNLLFDHGIYPSVWKE